MKKVPAVFVLGLITLWGAFGQAPTATEVMERVDSQRGPETARSRMAMRIFPNLDAQVHEREIRLISYARGLDDSLIEFVAPRSIAGLKVLDAGGAIRVFFPSTGRVRNIGGSGRGGSVGGVGGDFSYEDMGGAGFLEDYRDFRMVRETPDHYVISGVPTAADSRYSRLVFHVDRKLYVPVVIEYYEGENKVKRLDASRIVETGGRNVATHLTMNNFADNSRTEIRLQDVEWDVPLHPDLFHPNRFYR
ncbi:MAG: outer membrane lipoprotein-sorting protein [Spirochaetaceae bacterium]|nr:MAG: outer membrane lipoprotein-sorting protein [Spirochaetaceae bacterium]